MEIAKVGDTVIARNIKPFKGTQVCPPLKQDEEYPVKEVLLDKGGNPHYDVGLLSDYNYITSQETGEELDRGDSIHWCHPSRFDIKS